MFPTVTIAKEWITIVSINLIGQFFQNTQCEISSRNHFPAICDLRQDRKQARNSFPDRILIRSVLTAVALDVLLYVNEKMSGSKGEHQGQGHTRQVAQLQ
jgi:hypothetical protein